MVIKFDNEFIENAYQFELTLASLYQFFAKKVPQDLKLWLKMEAEEKDHARMIIAVSSYFSKDSAMVSLNLAFLQRLKNLRAHIKEYVTSHKDMLISRKEAFQKALEFEGTAIEVHFHEVFRSMQTQAKNDLFSKLREKDEKHMEDLIAYIKIHS